MTKAEAIYKFWSQFGLPAYEENSVYSFDKKPEFPYLTYELNTDGLSEYATPLSCSLWYRSSSWVQANAKAEEVSKKIGLFGTVLKCDSGYIKLMRGTPFCQSMGDSSDDMIKRNFFNILAYFFTAY